MCLLANNCKNITLILCINIQAILTFETKYLRVNQVKFGEDTFKKFEFKFFKSCLPQVLLGPFLNTLTHLSDKH